jgi:hypothetical protein
LRGEADAAYRPAGINHARPAQKKSAKPATLLVFEMYARQKKSDASAGFDVSAAARRSATRFQMTESRPTATLHKTL